VPQHRWLSLARPRADDDNGCSGADDDASASSVVQRHPQVDNDDEIVKMWMWGM
jgi:hypothetical protein